MNYKQRTISIILCLLFLAVSSFAAESDLDPSFSTGSGIGNTALGLARQADGKILVGGNFDTAGGTRRGRIARLNSDGSLDAAFARGIGFNSIIYSIAVQTDQKILVGGDFSSYDGIPRSFLARLNQDGTLDNSFAPQIGDRVLNLVVQPDGKVIIAGDFSTVNGSFNARRLARLNSNGSLDTTFNYALGLDVSPSAILLQPDGKLLIGGNNRLARLNADGSLDNSFNGGNPGLSGYVESISYAPNGTAIISGSSITAYNGTPRSRILRVFADGSLDAGFNPQTAGGIYEGAVNSSLVMPDGKIVITGFFETVGGVARRGLARLNADGTLDGSFNIDVPFAGAVSKLLSGPNGTVIVSGQFTMIGGVARNHIARLNADGTLDLSFAKKRGPNGSVFSIAPLTDGKILIGGDFTNVEEIQRRGIARLNTDGSLDISFNPGSGVDGTVGKVATQPDGKIIVAGFFTLFNGAARRSIARLNPNGSLDESFNAVGINEAAIADVEIQPDGKILIAGLFTNVGGASGRNIVRLNSDGTLDASFNPGTGADFEIYDVVLQPNGKILIGGNFDNFNNVARSSIAQLNQNGSLDTGFSQVPQFDNAILSIAVQNDGRIVVGGAFNNVGGTARNHVARLNANGGQDNSFTLGGGFNSGAVYKIALQPDGKILAGGTFYSLGGGGGSGPGAPPLIARLSANGAVDTTFNVGAISGGTNNEAEIDDIVLQSDGRILIGGEFSALNYLEANRIARLTGTYVAPNRKSFYDFDGDGKADISVFRPENGAWYLQQSQAGFAGIAFGLATDKLVPADYDGDGKTDVAVYRNGTWYLQRSQAGFTGVPFGDANDIPVPGDYDGDGRAELAVFRPSNGYWYVLNLSNNQFTATLFGVSTDRPVPADYDGDGKIDIAVNRNGTWYIQRSQAGLVGVAFGDGNDKLVPADYDGDGKADIAVFRPSNGTWYLLQSSAGFAGITFGLGTDTPVAADYDGDGKTDVAVVRNGIWYLNRSTSGFTGTQFGTSTDLPVPNAFIR